MTLSNRAYDILKFVALVLLPGFSAAYFSLGQIWGLPNVEQVVGTATVLDTFLGLLLKKSTSGYDSTRDQEPAPDTNMIIRRDPEEDQTYLFVDASKPIRPVKHGDIVRLRVVDETRK